MSKDKYPSIFSSQMETIVFITINIILQIFFATRTVLKIGEYINNSLHLARKYAGIFVCSIYVVYHVFPIYIHLVGDFDTESKVLSPCKNTMHAMSQVRVHTYTA